jgi:prepilin-type N-terminal cleavage/methylation domain-containing protein
MHRLTNHLSALRQARKSDGGFTLIELLIVIVILGVLAGIVVFSVRGITDRGDTAACKSSVTTVDTAYEAFVANGGTTASSAKTVQSLAPAFLHDAPTKIGGTAVTAATTVDQVDAIAC